MALPVPSLDELIKKAISLYKSQFGEKPSVAGVAPGRVNLIGEHTDYNDGFVFPLALSLVTVMVGGRNHQDECRVATELSVDPVHPLVCFDIPTKNPLSKGQPKWANYVKGVVSLFPAVVPGFNAVIVSSVPLGSGLSSSAALEVCVFTFLEGLIGQNFDQMQKALICQKAEHTFAGVPCGIMDQMISVRGIDGKILLIDCRSLEAELVELGDDSLAFLIVNTRVKHDLGGSDEYGKRKRDCEQVSRLLGVKALRDVTIKELEVLFKKEAIPELVYRRARHVIKENMRVYEAVSAIRKRDYEALGLLMLQSHFSLKQDYEVTCEELDSLVDIAMNIKGVFGARMTGAGFGGCTINLVKKSLMNEIISEMKEKYKLSTPEFIIGVPSTGARVLNLDKYLLQPSCY